ncbi:MAG: OadG family protein [Clostridia bacterium]|nr:OadG family protein [Clostridia bacterium]
MGDNLKLGFIILLTGIVIVFAVLILLICIIFVYGDIVSSIQNSIEKKKKEKEKEQAEKENEPVVQIAAEEPKEKAEASEVDEEEIPLDVVAAIAAAVDYIFGQGSVKIKSVKRSSKRRSAWKSAGVAENTRSFY